MRINVYSQELTSEILSVRQNGFTAVRWFLHSSPMLHHRPDDDDRSAVTIWLPKSLARREEVARTLEAMAKLVRQSDLHLDPSFPSEP